MPRATIPHPDYITETVTGAVYALPIGMVLVLGAPPDALAAIPPFAEGTFYARYAIPKYQPPHESVVPGLFAGESGGFFVGREAWDYLQRAFTLHPRADVVGLSSRGGTTQVFLRELDVSSGSVRVLLYPSPEAEAPLGAVSALLLGTGAPPLPAFLGRYLKYLGSDALG